ncbi:hypothetical protein [Chryseobacterium sp. FH1]|uniref:hypothetical protein n=1 Tax=Chryseobacterium sp. FH1 TaxID=1233951 RepID=UPI0004E40CFA|nr:hypothetical protein [Chryseobacterium sp. FH1]KFC20081.1 hypothetical protein IO90_12845 [Chryseobacterium sp. FH1]
MKINTLNDFKIIIKGQLGVNLPVILIILLFCYMLLFKFNLDYRLSVVMGFIIGWFLWGILIRKWIVWCLNHNVKPDRILKLGKRSLLLWGRNQIDEILKKRQKD